MIEKYSENQDMIRKAARMLARKKHPQLSTEDIIRTSETEEMIKEATFYLKAMELRLRLYEEYSETRTIIECERQAFDWYKRSPKELIQNIEEWVENKPITDIKIHGVSVNDIWKMYDKDEPFTRIVNFFIYWKESGFKNEDAHYYFFTMR